MILARFLGINVLCAAKPSAPMFDVGCAQSVPDSEDGEDLW
jgi:hypothetical protein